MSNRPALRWWHVGAAVVLPAIIAWSYAEFRSAYAGALAADRQAAECEMLADEIKGLRELAPASAAGPPSSTEFAKRLEELLRSPPLTGAQLVRIDPQPPKRANDSAYAERTTHLEVRQVTLRQLALLVDFVRRSAPECRIGRLRLQGPPRETSTQGAEMWGVEMTLTAWEYAPKTTVDAGRTPSRR
jgi:hypothetical protein